MNRRGFLSGLAAIAAGATLDPERLLWRPGAKLISIPAPPRVLLNVGDVFTIEGRYMVNPITGSEAVYTDPATGIEYSFLQRFMAIQQITTHDGDEVWRLKCVPGGVERDRVQLPPKWRLVERRRTEGV